MAALSGGRMVSGSGPRRKTGNCRYDGRRRRALNCTRPRVFCASLADVWDNKVPRQWRTDLFELIYSTPELDWLLLTKRPENIAKMLPY
jgi:protein gp37